MSKSLSNIFCLKTSFTIRSNIVSFLPRHDLGHRHRAVLVVGEELEGEVPPLAPAVLEGEMLLFLRYKQEQTLLKRSAAGFDKVLAVHQIVKA